MVLHRKNSERLKNSPAVLKVQTLTNGKTSTYTKQPDTERVIQNQCECRFTMAHRAPTMKHSLGVKLRYLLDKDVARSIIEGTYDIPTGLDNVTKLILKEIRKMRMKIRKNL